MRPRPNSPRPVQDRPGSSRASGHIKNDLSVHGPVEQRPYSVVHALPVPPQPDRYRKSPGGYEAQQIRQFLAGRYHVAVGGDGAGLAEAEQGPWGERGVLARAETDQVDAAA